MDSVSGTAIFAAQVRAAHALLDEDPIFFDPFALALAGVSEDEVRDLFTAIPDAAARVARVLPNQRARFFDEELEKAIHGGVHQVVLVGAGLDSLAWRRPDLMREINLFEVDHPVTQTWKQTRVAAIGLEVPPNLHFVGVDLALDGLAESLTSARFDPSRASLWSWLGVVVYLSVEAIKATLRTMSELAAPGSRLLASYSIPRELMDSDSREFDDLARAAAAGGGEPHITLLSPEEMEATARRAGWRTVRSVDPLTLSRYFADRTDDLSPTSYEWFLLANA